jgi:hypothetical protein
MDQSFHGRPVDEADPAGRQRLGRRRVPLASEIGEVPERRAGAREPDDDLVALGAGPAQLDRAGLETVDPQASVALVEHDLARLIDVAGLRALEQLEVVPGQGRPLGAAPALAAEARRGGENAKFLGHRPIVHAGLTFIKLGA